MNSFEKLKREHGTQPKPPLHLPDFKAWCDNCLAETGTKVFFMKQGLGNACDRCGRFRRGKRFLKKTELAELTKPERKAAEVGNEAESQV